MADYNKLIDEIKALDAKIDILMRDRAEKKQSLADLICPYKVGDLAKIKGYTHRGKACVIISVSLSVFCGEFEWKVYGKVLKKDGSESKTTCSWTGWQERAEGDY